jgi:hypothetical protein
MIDESADKEADSGDHPLTPSPDQPVSEDDLRKALAAAEAELNRLTCALPKTADDQAIVPGMDVWCHHTVTIPYHCKVVSVGDLIHVHDRHGTHYRWPPGEFSVDRGKPDGQAEAEDQNPEIPDPKIPSITKSHG